MPAKRLSLGAMKQLMEYDWPGNVRELAHVLERATILAEDRPEIAVLRRRFDSSFLLFSAGAPEPTLSLSQGLTSLRPLR